MKIKKWQMITIFVIVAVATISGGVYKYISSLTEEIRTYTLPNTFFEGLVLDGKTKEQVTEVVTEKINEYNQREIAVQVNGKTETYTWEQLGAEYTGIDVAEKIFQEQTGSISELRQMKKDAEAGKRKREYALAVAVNEETLAETLADKYNENIKNPKNATVAIPIKSTNLEVSKSEDGTKVNKEELKSLLIDAIINNQHIVEAPLQVVSPKLTTEKAKQLTFDVVSEYRTSLKARTGNPLHNITLAANSLNGAFLAPEEVYSHKGRVGYINAENGYKEATVYVAGEISEDIGGGVCQVSSTLYNAVLLADGEIVERMNHSRTVSYVPIGLDATVANYGPDFRFKNNTGSYLYIQSWIENNELVVRLLGVPTGKEVTITSQIDSETDTQIKAAAYKTVKKGGEITFSGRIDRSTYKK